ncbi:hypothetical protein [Bifidobacterium longum]|uniref:hypothetical protein n=1 Tax=Bifidobacterium longum TaxID=216816 RepID=UPI00286DDEC9|nr:hypothetical protein [Bifidobacterium longum]
MKTLDELMQHLCDNGIACSGELQKRELKTWGIITAIRGADPLALQRIVFTCSPSSKFHH